MNIRPFAGQPLAIQHPDPYWCQRLVALIGEIPELHLVVAAVMIDREDISQIMYSCVWIFHICWGVYS